MKRIVLAYSGGLVTSAAIAWLAEQQGAEIVTVTLDFGQARELAPVRERALALGAARAHVIDVRDELVRDFMLPALHAGALTGGHALTRSLIATRLLDVARMEAAAAVAHGGEPGSRSEAALHATIVALDPGLEVIAPARQWGLSAPELVTYARSRGVHVAPAERHRTDASLWGRVVTLGADAVPDAFTLTRSPEDSPDDPALLDIEFSSGVPIRVNGVEMSMIEMIESLETIAGAHGVGRIEEEGAVIEAPAVTVLSVAHRELETYVVGADLAALKAGLSSLYADAMVNGRWFSDIRAAIAGFAQVVQPRVTGTIRLRLLKGRCDVVQCHSVNAAVPAAQPTTSGVVA